MKILDALETVGVGCVIIGIIAACIITLSNPPEGSAAAELQDAIEEADKRFTVERHLDGIRIITDKETGVNYISFKSGYGVGLTVLVDETGKPVIQEESYENGQ